MQPHIEQKLLAAFEMQNSGRLEAAEEAYREVLKSDQRNLHALNLLGIICLNSQRPGEAVRLLSKAAKGAPDDAETQNNLGLAHKVNGNQNEAIVAFSKAVANSPPNPDLLNNLGASYSLSEQYDKAAECFERALRLQPNFPDALTNLASVLSALGRYEDARPIAERAAKLTPGSAEALNNLGAVLLKQCRYEAAKDCFERACALDSNLLSAAINKATTEKELGNFETAQSDLRRLADRFPDDPSPLYSLGVLFEQLGDIDQAAASYRRATDRRPDYAEAHYQLAQLKGRNAVADEIAKIEEQAKRPDLGRIQRKYLSFALGAVFEKDKHYEKALRHFQNAHSAVRSTYDHMATNRLHDNLKRIFGAQHVDSAIRQDEGPRPLFVLGMPRSGTSLVEQILASHSRIEGSGESSFLADAANAGARLVGKPFPDCVPQLTDDQLRSIGGEYLRRLREARAEAAWIVDKTPLNFQYIGFARRVLPSARFIHCRRNPLNTCFSIYKIPFDQNQNYAASFESLGQFYNAYRELMDFWRSQSSSDMLEIDYETLVNDSEGACKSFADFLGLDYEASMQKFYDQERLVRTPSASQVRQPIYHGSVDLAERYGKGLEPLRRALESTYG